MILARPFAASCLGLLAILSISCSGDHLSGPGGEIAAPAGVSVSNPRLQAGITASRGSDVAYANSAEPLAFVSAAPGTYPDAKYVSIRNETRKSSSVKVQVKDGGFDPVGIRADPGDDVSISIFQTGATPTVVMVKVPARRPPRVVRTSPSNGRVDVALNVVIEVVFTEPVDSSTVTSSSLSLKRDGENVAGTVHLSNDGLIAQFEVASLLSPGASYALSISPAIRDLDGDALADPATVNFKTADDVTPGTIIVSATTVVLAGGSSDPDGYDVQLDGQVQQHVDSNGETVFGSVSPGTHNLAVSGLAGNCVGKTEIRTLEVPPRTTVRTSFDIECAPPAQLDGMLAFVSERDGNSEIYVANADGTNIVRLTNDPAVDDEPAWSPDGQRIAFVSHRAGTSDIFVMNADGSNVVRLTSDGINESPVWSPDGKKLAFSTNRYGQFKINVMPADGSAAPTSVALDTGWNSHPAWSSDGTRIAFTSDSRAYDFLYDLFVVSLSDANTSLLLAGPFFFKDGLKFFFQAAWSPDGSKLAVVTCGYAYDNCYPHSTISIANADGSGLTDIAPSGGFSHPSWTSDGRNLVYAVVSCRECTATASIHYVSADGTRSGVLISRGYSPAWRPRN